MKGWKRSSWCNCNTRLYANQWPLMLIPLERKESFNHDYEMLQTEFPASCLGSNSYLGSHLLSLAGLLPLQSSSPFERGTEKENCWGGKCWQREASSLLLVFAVNISSCVTLAVTSWLDFFPGICSNFLGMLRGELKADGNEKCCNYWVS